MSTDFEQRLRSGMEQVAVRPRPGLAREAYQRYRTRRRTARTVAVTGTAMVAAAGTAVGLGAAGSGTNTIATETTAYVTSHANSALSSTNKIAYTYTRYTLGSASARNYDYGPAWVYNGRSRYTVLTSGGKRYFDDGDTLTSYGDVELAVNYPNRTWYRREHPEKIPPTPDLCSSRGGLMLLLVGSSLISQFKTEIESGLRCGVFTVAGRQRVGEIDALKLVAQVPQRSVMMTQTLWVDPSTFLPVQTQLNTHGHMFFSIPVSPSSGKEDSVLPRLVTTRFTWLPPTKHNLALLTPPIPPGFRQVSGQG
jgi:hypothetical protein